MVIGNSLARPSPARCFTPGYTMASAIANQFNEADKPIYFSAIVDVAFALLLIAGVVNILRPAPDLAGAAGPVGARSEAREPAWPTSSARSLQDGAAVPRRRGRARRISLFAAGRPRHPAQGRRTRFMTWPGRPRRLLGVVRAVRSSWATSSSAASPALNLGLLHPAPAPLRRGRAAASGPASSARSDPDGRRRADRRARSASARRSTCPSTAAGASPTPSASRST